MMKFPQLRRGFFGPTFFLLLVVQYNHALAEGTEAVVGSSFGGMLWFSFVSLMLGAALILLLAWLIRRNSVIQQPNRNTQILLQHALGTRERVIVLKILNRVLVLSQTPTQINLLTELDPEEIAELVEPLPIVDMSNSFANFFKVKKQ